MDLHDVGAIHEMIKNLAKDINEIRFRIETLEKKLDDHEKKEYAHKT